jgi:hypothetical protein
MQCDACRNEAVLFQPYSGRNLCRRHFVVDVEVKAKRSVRAHHWLTSGDHIAVVVSGDKKSGALLSFMKKLVQNRRDIRLSAIPAGGIVSASGSQSVAERIADSLEIPCIRLSGPAVPAIKEIDIVTKAETCSSQSIQDSLHEQICVQNNITRLALGYSLDDMAQGVLMRFLGDDLDPLIHSRANDTRSYTVICPLHSIASYELELYWDCQGTGIDLSPRSPVCNGFPDEVTGLLTEFYHRHPATKYALLHLGEQLSSGEVAAIPVTGTPREADFGDKSWTDEGFHAGVMGRGE